MKTKTVKTIKNSKKDVKDNLKNNFERKAFTFSSFESEEILLESKKVLVYKLNCGNKVIRFYSNKSYKPIYDRCLKKTNTISGEVISEIGNCITVKSLRYLKNKDSKDNKKIS